ncbi:hypothetical protein SRB17_26190 [Streptomyces sp. RB17]|uniref:hypothetical protein n=1 Tax=Streptomyces sp. RB17 TaxID=2585197 RepID=UPI0012972F03|nr:hypothetical protein [Streptomyces sp. RB17]MQY34649.1 hypothetical protein [Streptomyces sp. RB17]
MHANRKGTVAGLVAAALCLSVPAEAFAGSGTHDHKPSAYCGTDKASGLAVYTTQDVPCAAALQVAAAYTKSSYNASSATVDVRAAGSTWKCQERQGDPNPYQACVDTRDNTRLITLSS